MELLYLYLDDYKNFKKQGVCFSSQYRFNTEVVKNKLNLRIDFNPNYIPNFFDNPQIQNVTALIGQNGTGKSNILDFIKSSFPEGAGGYSENCVVGIKTIDNRLILHVSKELAAIIDDQTEKFEIEYHKREEKAKGFFINQKIEDFRNTSLIFYSNIVDLKIPSNLTSSKFNGEEEHGNVSGFQNISTMALLSQDQENFSNDRKFNIEKIDAYKAREIGRNIEFITSEHKNLLKFKLPEYLFIYLLNSDEQALAQNKEYIWVFEKIKPFQDEFKLKKEDKGMWFFNNFLKSLYFNLVRSDLQFSTLHVNIEHVEKASGETFHDFIKSIINNMAKGRVGEYSADYLIKKANVINNFIDFVFESLVKRYDSLVIYDEALFRIPINEEEKFNAKEFVDLYVQVKNITDFINFKFRSLSSGEQSLLSLVSRFYKLSDGRDYDKLKNNLIIMMDEGDLYYHPEWQRTFLNDILEYLPKIYPKRKIQFILTANTPYLASDLPKSNVVFLEKIKKGTKIYNPINDKEETFAANIHTLLSDSFFVSSFVGEFAKSKIEKLIQFLEKPQGSDYLNSETAYQLIKTIGEPLIRNRLLDMYYDQFPDKEVSIFDKRAELEKELQEINEQISQFEKNNRKGK